MAEPQRLANCQHGRRRTAGAPAQPVQRMPMPFQSAPAAVHRGTLIDFQAPDKISQRAIRHVIYPARLQIGPQPRAAGTRVRRQLLYGYDVLQPPQGVTQSGFGMAMLFRYASDRAVNPPPSAADGGHHFRAQKVAIERGVLIALVFDPALTELLQIRLQIGLRMLEQRTREASGPEPATGTHGQQTAAGEQPLQNRLQLILLMMP